MNVATADLPFSPAADRNKEAILHALRSLLPPTLSVLEIAAGTGQHAQHFASNCPGWTWQPSDADTAMLPVIDARCASLSNVLPALPLDVAQALWPAGPTQGASYGAVYDAVYCANLLHISPWSSCASLMKGAAAQLGPNGWLLLYGPFRRDGVATALSNEAFDRDLKARNPAWGLRSLAAVEALAIAAGLTLHEVRALPANNLLLALRAR